MTKNLILLSLVIIIGLVAFSFFGRTTPKEFSTTSTNSQVVQSTDVPSEMESTKYITSFSTEKFNESKNMKRVLFFYANWCPTCRPVDVEIQNRLNEIPNDLVIYRVNYNDPDTDATEKALAQKYGITYQHTFVYLDSSDSVIKKWNGGDLNQLLTTVK